MRGRETIKKAIVAIAAEVDGRKIGRIRLRWVPDLSAPVLRGFVKDSPARGNDGAARASPFRSLHLHVRRGGAK